MNGLNRTQTDLPNGVFKPREVKAAAEVYRRVNYRQQSLVGSEQSIRRLLGSSGEAKRTFNLRTS